MLYQFAGDEAIGLFGIPDHPEAFTDTVLDTALALCRIGDSVSQHWQRRIDRVQSASGLHVGIAIGDLQIVAASVQPTTRGRNRRLHQRGRPAPRRFCLHDSDRRSRGGRHARLASDDQLSSD
jgi:hypothetical protein